MSYTVGSVPYVNAIPLVASFEEAVDSRVKVLYDLPSKLPAMLESGVADAILVSSVDALRTPGRRMAAGVCIGSDGPVKSVRLFSKVPPEEIQSLALDQSSMTSNRLAQIVLAERYGARPSCEQRPPSQSDMLAEFDACVLIGDIGMLAASEGLHVLDLGEEWRQMTGLPFVWAAWIGADRLTPELAGYLNDAGHSYSVGRTSVNSDANRQQRIIAVAQARAGWTEEMLRDYFLDVMVYDMDVGALEGLREFQRRLLASGFDDCRHFPKLVAAE